MPEKKTTPLTKSEKAFVKRLSGGELVKYKDLEKLLPRGLNDNRACLRVRMCRIRDKLEACDEGALLVSVYGTGYQLLEAAHA